MSAATPIAQSWPDRLARIAAATRLAYTQALAVELTYRFALAQSFLGVGVGLVGLLLFWLAAARAAVTPAYPAGTLVGYFVVSAALAIAHEYRLSFNLSASIRMGKLSASMLRPYPFLLSLLAQAAAHATLRALVLVPLVATLLATLPLLADLAATIDATRLALFALAVGVSLAAGWAIKTAVGLLAFDLTQTWGPELIFLSIYSVASGAVYPPDLLPPSAAAVVAWTPVYYMIGCPTLILVGRLEGAAAWAALARGSIVAAATTLLVVWMWRRGTRRFEAIGI